MSENGISKYPGKRAEVAWHSKLCIHVGECGRAKGDLFVGGRRPWCDPDVASNESVKEVVLRCPTGALSVTFDDGNNPETAAAENTVTVAYNGPLFVRGELNLEGAPVDAPGVRYRAALCRCGYSKNKPFCDNSHEDAGFKDFGAVGETGSDIDNRGGTLSVSAADDGPLLLKGNLTIVAASGRRAWHGDRVALCRCGASDNKPFCDGSHKRIGFTSAGAVVDPQRS